MRYNTKVLIVLTILFAFFFLYVSDFYDNIDTNCGVSDDSPVKYKTENIKNTTITFVGIVFTFLCLLAVFELNISRNISAKNNQQPAGEDAE